MQKLNNKINFFDGKTIKDMNILSNAFGTTCKKVELDNGDEYVVKQLIDKKDNYNSIYYEGKSLQFMHKKFPKLFPQVFYLKDNILIMQYIKHNKIKKKESEKELALIIAKIHQNKNDSFGFEFDPPIGGIKQPSKYSSSWSDFFSINRLLMIYEKISLIKPMPKEINILIENLIKNIKNFIPNNPKPSLIHGDMWEGNILLNDGKIIGLIDPGIYYAHNEMELAYLQWFNYISKEFYAYYSEHGNIDKDYFKYSEIYQLYYCLLNVHLWSREYIKDTYRLLEKFK